MSDLDVLIADARNFVSSGTAITAAELRGAYLTIDTRLKSMGYYANVPNGDGTFTRVWVDGITASPAVLPAPPPIFGRWETDAAGNPTAVPLSRPVLPNREFVMPGGAPGAPPAYQDIDDLPTDALIAPVNTATSPGALVLPPIPTTTAVFNAVLPEIKYDFVFPEPPPELVNPVFNKPVIADHAVPVSPGVVIPTLSATAPTQNIEALPDLTSLFANSYSDHNHSTVNMVEGYVDVMLAKYNPQYHAQMAAIEAQLSKYLAGGTGLDPSVETAIYTRSTSKQSAEARRTRDAAWEEAASRGHTLAGGIVAAGIRKSRQAEFDSNAASAREIVVMQAEYEQKNLQFAVSTSIGLRATMVQATLGYMQNLISISGQSLEFAKATVANIIEKYNSAIKLFSLELDVYRAEIAVYEMHIRGAMAAVELYRAEISALEALVSVDRARIDMFKAEIDTLNTYANVYRTRIEVVQSRAALEKTKVDIFGSQVSVFSSQVQADNAKWSGFKAQVDGELAKVEVYGKEIAAFTAETGAFKAKLDGETGLRQAQAAVNDSRTRQYLAEVSAFNAQVGFESTKTQALIESDRQVFNAFGAEIGLAVAQTKAQLEVFQTKAQFAQENVKNELAAGAADAQFKQSYAKMLVDVQMAAANIWSSQSGAALAGINTMAVKSEQA